MSRESYPKIASILMLIGVVCFVFSSLLGWQAVSITYSGEHYASMTQEFTPMGFKLSFSSNYSNYSAFLFYPSEVLEKNNTNVLIIETQHRAVFLQFIWYLEILTFILLLLFGIFASINKKKLLFPISLVTSIVILLSIIIFLVFYQGALNSDLNASGLPSMNMFGDETIANGDSFIGFGVIDSFIGFGLIMAVLSFIFFFISAFLYMMGTKLETTEDVKKEEIKNHPEIPLPKTSQIPLSGTPEMVGGKRGKKEERKENENIKKIKIQCPNCGNIFEVEVDMTKLPVKVQCPYCGTEGEIG